MTLSRKMILAALILMGSSMAVSSGEASIRLLPHRAVYDLNLAKGAAPMGDKPMFVDGRMQFEFSGASCEGYTVNFRFAIEMGDGQGGRTLTDMVTSSFEDAEGENFEFLSQTFANKVLMAEIKGSARREAGKVTLSQASPDEVETVLPGSPLFPTNHIVRLIEAAKAGKKVVVEDLFDGTYEGERVYRTTAIIGAAQRMAPDKLHGKIGTSLRWPVNLSYFDAAVQEDQTPEYTVSLSLWENGVSSDLVMDYGDVALEGKLISFEPLMQKPCP